jgi:hypothetical protein
MRYDVIQDIQKIFLRSVVRRTYDLSNPGSPSGIHPQPTQQQHFLVPNIIRTASTALVVSLSLLQSIYPSTLDIH